MKNIVWLIILMVALFVTSTLCAQMEVFELDQRMVEKLQQKFVPATDDSVVTVFPKSAYDPQKNREFYFVKLCLVGEIRPSWFVIGEFPKRTKNPQKAFEELSKELEGQTDSKDAEISCIMMDVKNIFPFTEIDSFITHTFETSRRLYYMVEVKRTD